MKVTLTGHLLAQTLVDLSDLLSDGADEHQMYAMLTQRSAEVLDMSATALLLNNQRGLPRLVATGGSTLSIDLQIDLQGVEGPCLNSCQTGQSIHVEDLADYQNTWPQFTASMMAVGFRSVHSLPMGIRGQHLGSLSLFSTSTRALDRKENAIAQAMTDIATVALLLSRAVRQDDEMGRQLERARVATQQAKGVVAERLAVRIEAADELHNLAMRASLRRASDVSLDKLLSSIPFERPTGPRNGDQGTSAPL